MASEQSGEGLARDGRCRGGGQQVRRPEHHAPARVWHSSFPETLVMGHVVPDASMQRDLSRP